jgi:hypothetical protein
MSPRLLWRARAGAGFAWLEPDRRLVEKYGEDLAEEIELYREMVGDPRTRVRVQDLRRSLSVLIERGGRVAHARLQGELRAHLERAAWRELRLYGRGFHPRRFRDLLPFELVACARRALRDLRRSTGGAPQTSAAGVQMVRVLLAMTPGQSETWRRELIYAALVRAHLGGSDESIDRYLRAARAAG